jgi:hypothetical protein
MGYLFIFLVSWAHLFAKDIADTGKLIPSNFIFKKYMIVTEKGISNFISNLDSMARKIGKPEVTDSALDAIKESVPGFFDLVAENNESTLHLEIRNDSMWRYEKQKGSMIGDYYMMQKNSGVLHYYNKARSLNYNKVDLFAKKTEFEITENRNDRKIIKGYSCFKMTLVEKSITEEAEDFGNTIYEMYVTDQIKLPVHSVVYLSRLIPDLFPMEVKIMGERFAGITEVYELIEVN